MHLSIRRTICVTVRFETHHCDYFSQFYPTAIKVNMSFYDAVDSKRWRASKQYPLSNISMDGWKGGKLHVPPSDYDAFLLSYSSGLLRNEKLFMIELRTSPLFKWYADLDMMMPTEICHRQIVNIVRIIQNVISEHLNISGKNRLKLLGLSTEPKQKDDMVKTGLHIIAPNIVVSVDNCMDIQQKCIARLKENITLRNEWSDAFDTSVYKGSGLRMLGSRKIEFCKCKTGCDSCKGVLKIDSGRAYGVSFLLNGDGQVNSEETDTLKRRLNLAVKMSSIKSFEQLQTGTPQRLIPVPSLKRCALTELRAPDELDIRGLVEYHLHSSFGSVEIVKMVKMSGGVVFSVKGCKFCMNVNREHSNSNIYFFLGSNGELTQRCHCPKYSCKSYHGPPIVVTTALMRKCGMISPEGLPPGFANT